MWILPVIGGWAAAEVVHAVAALFMLATSRELFDDPRTVRGLCTFLELWIAFVFSACLVLSGSVGAVLNVQLFLLARLVWCQVAGAHLAWEAALRRHHEG